MKLRLRIDGTVQGVGFRPFVYRLASELGLSGFVRNDAQGVVVEVDGNSAQVEEFAVRVRTDAPPLARVGSIVRESERVHDESNRLANDVPVSGAASFRILISDPMHAVGSTGPSALVPPDVGTCDDCLRELFNPLDRRYQYPFINCTNCGPRFTIVQGVPYDRQLTTMAAFQMCERCQAEYDDPASRRFHAEPNACANCGPAVQLVDAQGAPVLASSLSVLASALVGVAGRSRDVREDNVQHQSPVDAIVETVRALKAGALVAIKGVGGYHLACLASHRDAVQRLRDRKHRPHKPFALMARNIHSATELVEVDEAVAMLLASRERPIVLAVQQRGAPVADNVAPRLHELGVMLPYSPLHHLLMQQCDEPLVMTSGNIAGEPIAYRDADARDRLGGIADCFLTHNREIETPTDDSVMRALTIGTTTHALMIRRSRGFAPAPLTLPLAGATQLVACGAQLKNTYCVVNGSRAWVGPHVGDLEQFESVQAYRQGIAHHENLFGVKPTQFVHDLHPGYASTAYAIERATSIESGSAIAVQHHHAHFAGCLAEHNHSGVAIGVVFDGTGLGTDSTLWGGEILVGDLTGFRRAAHLWPARMPGGEAAIREPWRMACGWLCELGVVRPELPVPLREFVTGEQWNTAAQIARVEAYSPSTTSAGRLLDAVAALCGIRQRISYEGQAAIELEAIANIDTVYRYDVPIVTDRTIRILEVRPLVAAVCHDIARNVQISHIAAAVHNGLAHAIANCCTLIAKEADLNTVVLSGGVFQNVLLLKRSIETLRTRGLRVLFPEKLPSNDGGIAFGQAAAAAARNKLSRNA